MSLDRLKWNSFECTSIPQASSGIPSSVFAFAYDILIFGIQPSIVPPCVDSLPTKVIVLSFILGPIMYSDDQKRFEKFNHLGPPKFSSAIREDAY